MARVEYLEPVLQPTDPTKLAVGVPYTVTDRSDQPVTIYDAESGGNALTTGQKVTDAHGLIHFWIDEGRYKRTYSAPGQAPKTYTFEARVGGVTGATMLSGSGAPSAGTGVDGNLYLDTTNSRLYGPKTAGAWGAGTSLIGPVGPQGPPPSDASTTTKGISKLSVAPASSTNPIAVGDNDTRMTNARTPTAHASTHDPNGSDPITRFLSGTLAARPAASAANAGLPYYATDTGQMFRSDGTNWVNVQPGELGFAEITTQFTTVTTQAGPADVTGLSVTVTVGVRPIVVALSSPGCWSNTAGKFAFPQIQESTTQIQYAFCGAPTAAGAPVKYPIQLLRRLTPTAGSHTYKVTLAEFAGNGTSDQAVLDASATGPALLRVYEV